MLERIREIDAEISVVMLTAFASVETAVAAIKCGAFDYLTKPFKNDEVLNLVGNGIRQRRLARENRTLREQLVRRNASTNSSGSRRGCRRCTRSSSRWPGRGRMC